MNKLEISENFTIDDIHKIRDCNFETVQSLSELERRDYYKNKSLAFLKDAGITPLCKDEVIQAVR